MNKKREASWWTILPMLTMTMSFWIGAQDMDWDKFREEMRKVREGKVDPEWADLPHRRDVEQVNAYEALLSLMAPTKDQELELDEDGFPPRPPSLLQMRYGDITEDERWNHDRIVNSLYVPKQDHIIHSLAAHGVEEQKGGIANLINIILDGRIFTKYFGPLVSGDPSIFAGNHGPFFVIIDTSRPKAFRDRSIDFPAHAAYLIPGERHRQKIENFLAKALGKGLISLDESQAALRKILTYEEFIALAARRPSDMKADTKFAAAVQELGKKREVAAKISLINRLGLVGNLVDRLERCGQR